MIQAVLHGLHLLSSALVLEEFVEVGEHAECSIPRDVRRFAADVGRQLDLQLAGGGRQRDRQLGVVNFPIPILIQRGLWRGSRRIGHTSLIHRIVRTGRR